jgi:transposase
MSVLFIARYSLSIWAGHSAGIGHIKRIEAILDNTETGLPSIVQEECRDLLAQIGEKTALIDEKARRLAELSLQSGTSRRLQTMPVWGC